jgi:hypothetical protein
MASKGYCPSPRLMRADVTLPCNDALDWCIRCHNAKQRLYGTVTEHRAALQTVGDFFLGPSAEGGRFRVGAVSVC